MSVLTDGTDSIFDFLLIAGYLKPVSSAAETEYGTFMEMALSNKEILRVYNTEILSWIKGLLTAINYDTDMKDRGIKDIVKYGIAISGKKVEIAL